MNVIQINEDQQTGGFTHQELEIIQQSLKQNGYAISCKDDHLNVRRKDNEILQNKLNFKDIVITGIHISSGINVAIKIYRNNNDQYLNINEQIDYLQKINHLYYIAKVYDHFLIEKEQIIIIITELYPMNLDLYLDQMEYKQQDCSITVAANLILQSINALCEMDINGLTHSNIKPSNILFNNEGDLKLVDFRYTKKQQNDPTNMINQSQSNVLDYKSPVLQNQTNTQRSTDIYSMGLCMLEILGLKIDNSMATAIQENNFDDIDEQIQSNSQNLYSFIKYFMLQKEPRKRTPAIQLRKKFLHEFGHDISKDLEEKRIRKQISSLETNIEFCNKKQLAFLYYLLSETIEYFSDESLIKKSLDILYELKMFETYEESVFLESYSNILMRQNQSEMALTQIKKSHQIIRNLYQQDPYHIELVCSYFTYCYRLIEANSEPEQIVNISLIAVQIVNEIFTHDHPYRAESLNINGLAYLQNQKYFESKDCFEKAIEMSSKLFKGNNLWKAIYLGNIGLFYNNLGVQNTALFYFMPSLQMLEALIKGNHKLLANIYNNTACANSKQKDITSSIYYLKKSLEMEKAMFKGNNIHIAQIYIQIGQLYKNSNIHKSLSYMKKGIKMISKLNDDYREFKYLSNCYFFMSQLYQTKHYFEKCSYFGDYSLKQLLKLGQNKNFDYNLILQRLKNTKAKI